MTSGERISQLHDVARPGELRKGLRLVDDLQTYPPIYTLTRIRRWTGMDGVRTAEGMRELQAR